MAEFDARAEARKHTIAAIAALVYVVNKTTSVSEARVLAARTLLELGYGLLNGEIGMNDLNVAVTQK